MIQQETRLRVADNSGAAARRSRAIGTAWLSRAAEPHGLVLGADLRGMGAGQ